jgi:hypothetical protein
MNQQILDDHKKLVNRCTTEIEKELLTLAFRYGANSCLQAQVITGMCIPTHIFLDITNTIEHLGTHDRIHQTRT